MIFVNPEAAAESVCIALMSAGFYFAAAEHAGLPNRRTAKMVTLFTKGRKPISNIFIDPIAALVCGKIRLSEHKRNVYMDKLDKAGLDVTPEYYKAVNITVAFYLALGVLIVFMISHMCALLFAAISIYILYKRSRQLDKKAARHKEAVEMELPKFISVIRQTLVYSPDTYYAIKNYSKVAGKEFGREIKILLRDMATGDRITALSRFALRMGSDSVSEIVRGLISVEKGEDMSLYLDGLEIELRSLKINAMRIEARHRKEELRPAHYALIGVLILNVFILFGSMLYQYWGGLFG